MSNTTLDLTTLNLSVGTHTIKVKAKGDNYQDSAFSNEVSYVILPQLEAPIISLDSSILDISTGAVQNAEFFVIYSNNTELATIEAQSSNIVDLSEYLTKVGTYSITVKATAVGYADSSLSNSVSYTVLMAPTISLNGSTLTISGVQNATSYTIYSNNAELANVLTNEVNLKDLIVAEGTYAINAIAKGTGNYGDSPLSNTVTYTATPFTGYNLTVTEGGDGGSATITYFDGTTGNVSASDGEKSNVVGIRSVSYNGDKETYYLINDMQGVSLPYELTGDTVLYIYTEPCFIEGTPITLSNHTYKNVEDITYDDNLLVWDFDKGEFSQAKPLWIMKQKKAIKYNHLVFSDNSELNTINQHRIFNIEKGMFTYPMTEDTPIGTHTLNDKGEVVELISKEVIEKEVNYYNIITNYHINLFAGHILTSCRLSNIYPIKDFKYVKDNREIIPFEKFDVPKEYYNGLRLGEQPTDINRDNAVKFGDNSVEDYVKRLIRDKK